MKAVSCLGGNFEIVDLPDPTPRPGQLVLAVERSGICGSDLHARHHANEAGAAISTLGYKDFIRNDTPAIMGHEFCGVVADRGSGVAEEFTPGALVVSVPLVRADGGVHLTGLSARAPGGFAEFVVIEAALSFLVPNGLSAELAALTEPMSVALHAVNRSGIGKGDIALVVGCGPVGLALISHLKARGVRTVVASDFSPRRRELATRCGADVVVNPEVESPYERTVAEGTITTAPDLYELTVSSMEELRGLPAWSDASRVAGAGSPERPVIFECVGRRGMVDEIVAAAPLNSRVVVVGVCMGVDEMRPTIAQAKEVDIVYAFGYTPLEFRDTLHMLADGKVDGSPLLTGTVGLGGVAAAFDALGDPETHAKILVDPASAAVTL